MIGSGQVFSHTNFLIFCIFAAIKDNIGNNLIQNITN